MKNLVTFVVVMIALAFVPAGSYAQMMTGHGQDEKAMTSDTASKSMAKTMEFQASRVIGRGVQNYRGEYLGVIRDLMVDPLNGGVTFAILSQGGTLGIPMKYAAVPFSAVSFDPARNVYLLDMARDKLAAAPGFDRGEWPRYADRTWEADVYRYYGQTPAWGESGGTVAESQGPAYRFSEIRGTTVRNTQGEKLGFIRDLVVDSEGHVPAAVLAHGGFLGIDAKWVAVSLSDLRFDPAKHSFVLSWTKERLDAAPAFQVSEFGGPSWAERAYEDYGAYPME